MKRLLSTNKMLAYFVLGFAAFIVVLLIWLPFGFTLIGLIEEWNVLGLFSNNALFFVADVNSLMSAQAGRPLTIFPHAIAYYLDQNSFFYWHVLLMLALIIKGSAAGQLIWKTTDSLSWAVVMAMLVILYPADTMQLSFRALHINLALALLLVASSIFMVAYEENKRPIAYMLAIVATGLSFAAICMYEAALFLAPLPFLLLFAKSGLNAYWQQLRTKVGLLLTWSVAPALYVGYFVWVSHKVVSYQSQLMGDNKHIIASLRKAIPVLIKIGALRSLVGGWFDALRIVLTEYNSYTYLFVATLLIMSVVLFSKKYKQNDIVITNSHFLLRLALVGFILLILGYAPTLLIASHLNICQRTFLFASPGAALLWVVVLIYIARSANWLAWLMASIFIFFGFGMQIFQFNHYIQLGEKQRTTLKSIIENINVDTKGKTIVIRDESNMIGHTWMLMGGNLPYQLSYFYGHPIKAVEVCRMPSHEWQHRDRIGRSGTCVETKNEWVFKEPEPLSGLVVIHPAKPIDIKLKKSDVITITVQANGLVLSNPDNYVYQDKLRTDNSLVALRYRGILAEKPWPLHLISFKDQAITDYYKWSFGKWWSLELPIRGTGWREAEWNVNKFYHEASAWQSQGNSSLYFEFLPTKDHYVLTAKFVRHRKLHIDIRASTYVRINQINIPLHWNSATEFEATIPSGVMVAGLNRIDFNSKIDPTYYGLSSKLAWFEVA